MEVALTRKARTTDNKMRKSLHLLLNSAFPPERFRLRMQQMRPVFRKLLLRIIFRKYASKQENCHFGKFRLHSPQMLICSLGMLLTWRMVRALDLKF
mmetsp:Transcript_36053/g.67137  ORF Transcript_36053/g.67137 Transcript_36053/m.67137 type:complete len:97 (-) Transcript_36053:723-1013(-)